MVKLMKVSVFAIVAALLLVTVAKIPVAEAQTCSPKDLTPCAPAILSSEKPSAACCAKLKEQKTCFCGYLRNPSLRQYVSSPNAKNALKNCNIAAPTC